jgi:cytochrome c
MTLEFSERPTHAYARRADSSTRPLRLSVRLTKTVGFVGLLLLGGDAGAHDEGSAQGGAPAPVAPPADANFQLVPLNGAPGEPIGLVVLPDGRVLHTTRGGNVWLHDPASGFNTVAGVIPVYAHDEEGLQGIAIDADFARNGWVYIYYSPPLATPLDDPSTPSVNEGDAPFFGTPADFAAFKGVMRLSRFQLRAQTLDVSSEQKILEVPVDRGICCHVGGDIDFDAAGNLYLSTGDDTNPFESSGYAPIDARPGRHPAFDAQRSSANTNDLRGKLLRIAVRPDGSYTIPKGNLFAPGTPKTRPEIYAMGLRNPFRFAVDRQRGVVYLADYSPDAQEADPARGPAGQGKWTIIERPGNYGWPYCATAELPYRRFDFDSGASGEPFDCRRPVNDSPNNTGLRRLPRVVQPDVWYGGAASAEFPELGTGGVGPMAGPAYHYDRRLRSDRKWPRYYDGVPIFYEWTRDALFPFQLRAAARHSSRSLELAGISRLLGNVTLQNPIDLEFGPDGALYLLEYGEGYFGELPEARLSRIDYLRGNATPIAVATADVSYGYPPLTVQLSSAGSSDPDGDALSFFWDFDSDGSVDSSEPNPSVTYTSLGRHAASLRVVDATGRSSTTAARIVVGNIPPVVSFDTPAFGMPFEFGDTVAYSVSVSDDGPVDCARVEVQYVLGHDAHGHSLSTARGCTGSFDTALDEGHAGAENIAAVFVASYTDAPSEPAVPALTSQAVVVLFPPISAPLGGEEAP